MARKGTPRNVGEGLDAASRSLVGALMARQAGEQAKKLEEQAKVTADAEIFGSPQSGADYFGWLGGGPGGAPSFGGIGGLVPPAPQQPWKPNAAEASEMMMRGRPDPSLSFGMPEQPTGGMMPVPNVPLSGPVGSGDAGGFLAGSAGSDTITGSAGQDTLLGGPTPYQQPHLTFGDIQPQPAPSPAAGSPAAGNGAYDQVEAQYGLPAGYLHTTAGIESSHNPNAKNPRSSAGGLFQFIDSTARQYGLKNRFDPVQATDAAARLARDNAQQLRRVLGRDPTGAELYLAHQQGGAGAAKLLANPNAPATSIVGRDAVRLNGGNANMTAGQFANLWISKFNKRSGGGGKMPFTSTQGRAAPPAGVEPFRYANVGFDVPGDTGSAPQPTAVQYNPQSGQINLPELPPEFRPQRSSREIMAYIQQNGPRMSRQVLAIAQRDLQRALDFEDPWKNFQMRKQYAEMIGWEPQSDPLAGFITDEQEAQLGLDQSGVYRIGTDGKVQIVQEPSQVVTPKERPMKQGADGRWRYTDGEKELVFPDVQIPEENGGEVDPKDLANFRKEFSTLQPVKEFSTQADAYSRILASAANPSAAGDLSLIFQYMKVLDPTSVVRESEFAMAASAGSYGERIKSAVERAKNGERLSDDIRADFVKRAEMLYNESERKFTDLYRQYAGRADRLGYSQEDALNDFRYKGRNAPETSRRPMARPEPQAAPTPAPQAGNAPPESFVQNVPADEDAQGLWDYMTPEQRALFQ
jgi:hypothetical protein